MEDHLPYIESLNAKTIVVAGAADPVNQNSVVGNKESEFSSLVKSAEAKCKFCCWLAWNAFLSKVFNNINSAAAMKVVVDLIIDAMSINNVYFNQSSDPQCTTPSGGNMCNFFMWINNNATQDVCIHCLFFYI